MRLALALALVLGLGACAQGFRDREVPMRAVAALDVVAYAGRWYEVARFPVRFQEGCTATVAEYGLREDGRLSVRNSCRIGAPDGPERSISGQAWVVEGGRLSVQLGWIPFPAPYWVLWVDEDYEVAVVGVPSGVAGWILARSPEISEARLAEARAVLQAAGYDLSRLELTVH
ncbi:MAG: lipocalin family protein [Alkalilacustris sp.]